MRNFPEETNVTWIQFRAAFVLDYKNRLEEFSEKGHLNVVLDDACEKLSNKNQIVSKRRYMEFVGCNSCPDEMWNKIAETAAKILFKQAVEDSLCLS